MNLDVRNGPVVNLVANSAARMGTLSACILLLGATAPVRAQDESPKTAVKAAISVGEKHTIMSEVLGEDRRYMVYLPDGCKAQGANAPCPVLFVLDGGSNLFYGSGMLARMSESAQIPDMIMVAIPNGSDRGHDLTPTHSLVSYSGQDSSENATSGGTNAFLDFLEQV